MSRPSLIQSEPVFVVGASRSGTTLLQLMLNAHARIGLQGEVHFFGQIGQIRRQIPSISCPEDLNSVLEMITRTSGFNHLPDAEGMLERVADALRGLPNPTYEDLYLFMIRDAAEQQNKPVFGEKTPENVRYIPHLRRIFPNSRVVHIVRDPRAVVASLLRVPWASDDVVTTTLKWRADVHMGRAAGREPWCHELKYEDLVRDPKGVLTELCDFLGERYDPAMLEYHKTAESQLRNEPWKENTLQSVSTDRIDKWQDSLEPGQVAVIEAVAGRLMKQLGYARTTSLSSRMWSTVVRAPIEFRKYLRYKRLSWAENELVVGENRIVLISILKLLLPSWQRRGQ